MLLQTLRQSRALARWVLVCLALAMGVAVAAPVVQPLDMGGICSAAGNAGNGESNPDGLPAGSHHALQCVLCLGLSAPPQACARPVSVPASNDGVQLPYPLTVVGAPRPSPLIARAPPQV